MADARGTGGNHRPTRIRWRRWVVALGVVLGAGALFWLDDRLKDRPASSGYHPNDASWVLQCANLPRFWLHAQNTDEMRAAVAEKPDLFNRLELATRKTTGIRPTPLRWSVWLGKRFTAAESPDGIGVCVYPGLLTRAAAWIYEHTAAPKPISGVYRAGSVFYGWRDGYLIASNTALYVQGTLTGRQASAPSTPLRAYETLFYWGDNLQNQIRIAATDEFPISGHLRDTFTAREAPLTLTDAWPESPLLSITSSSWDDMATAIGQTRTLLNLYNRWPVAESLFALLWREWQLGDLPEAWDRQADITEMAFTVLELNTDSVLPAPQSVLVMRTPGPTTGQRHPLYPIIEPLQSIPHEWHGQSGTYAPLLGEKLSICLGRNDTDWLAANSEPAMATALAGLQRGEQVDADLTVRMNWGNLGNAMAAVFDRAAEYELVPGRNRKEVAESIVPQLRSLAPLGEMTLVGNQRSDRLVFQGLLCRQVGAN